MKLRDVGEVRVVHCETCLRLRRLRHTKRDPAKAQWEMWFGAEVTYACHAHLSIVLEDRLPAVTTRSIGAMESRYVTVYRHPGQERQPFADQRLSRPHRQPQFSRPFK